MIDEKAVKEGLSEWLKNPHWAKYYNEAPSDRCKQYISLEFYYDDTESEEVANALDYMESGLSLEDWKHLYKWCGNNPRKGVIASRIAELEQ